MTDQLSLDDVSVLLIWTAIAIYALAFIAYAIDLSRRSAQAVDAQDATVRERELVGAGGETIAQVRASEEAAAVSLSARGRDRSRPVWARIGTAMAWLGFLFHLGATITRGIEAERVPWSNMYEFSMTGTLLIVAVYLGVLFRYDLRFLGSFIMGLVAVLMGGATLFHVDVSPLSDPLKSVWLVIHVFVASLATALFALAFALSVVQLLQARRERKALEAAVGTVGKTGPGFLRILPSATDLESLAYRFAIIGFIFWTFTLIAGSIWANDAWGRYWGFDTKEVWTFVIWVLYAGYIHARATRGWRGTRSAWLSIIGFAAVMFNFTIVNMFFKGLHVYSGLS
ncbi:c-type cytochrome biogenesis protein CcsB [Microbacterium sp. cx-55]|uniref:c-type cytochrome biogenesis protein CcsB n=1 Tax=Microbacterium sp. cx-55 TaxID=2875948 RepID=UPI001CBBEA75|nr:c-type cytochrome biogenesis protein CcsB [Microbacterium sp. cx-55]MBZ4487849.1 c-type cytochrome biogenesis protein CcsB [Microbacterium sp. cx-55]UGB34740.1 c-type cytochrome biogenesis protein CcsB [Microbacterium sp. cx-55]